MIDLQTQSQCSLTSVYEFEALVGPRPITIKLNPHVVGGAVDDDIRQFTSRKIAQKS